MTCTFKITTTRDELLRAMVVRSIVFIGEQRCPFREEFDGLDTGAIHVLGEDGGEPVAAGRIRDVDGWAKLERIAVLQPARGRGLGHELVEYMLDVARARGFRRFKMHAQVYLVDFYRKHGFEPRGEIFEEAGIEHYLMVREQDGEPAEFGPIEPGSLAPGVGPPRRPEPGWPAGPEAARPLPTEAWPTRPEPAPRGRVHYVGFWARLGATLVDSFLFILLSKPILVAYYGWEYFEAEWLAGQLDFALSYVFPAVATIVFWYKAGATPGKMLIHARIVDARTGGRASLGQLVGRYLGYIVSSLPFGLGLLWVAWDPRKQGWHDKLAGTVVVHTGSRLATERLAGGQSPAAGPERPRDDDWMPF